MRKNEYLKLSKFTSVHARASKHLKCLQDASKLSGFKPTSKRFVLSNHVESKNVHSIERHRNICFLNSNERFVRRG